MHMLHIITIRYNITNAGRAAGNVKFLNSIFMLARRATVQQVCV